MKLLWQLKYIKKIVKILKLIKKNFSKNAVPCAKFVNFSNASIILSSLQSFYLKLKTLNVRSFANVSNFFWTSSFEYLKLGQKFAHKSDIQWRVPCVIIEKTIEETHKHWHQRYLPTVFDCELRISFSLFFSIADS